MPEPETDWGTAPTEKELRDRYPWIPWDAPLRIIDPADPLRELYICRLCVGLDTVSLHDAEHMYQSVDEHEQHLRSHHNQEERNQ